MGKKDKHKQGQSRNNPVFKVMGGGASKVSKGQGNKQKAQEVKSKLKKVRKMPKTRRA